MERAATDETTLPENIREVKVKNGDIATYDSDMPMGVMKKLLGAARNGNLDGLISSLSKFIVSWPYEGDPANEESWDAVTRTQFNSLVGAVTDDLGSLGE